MIRPRDVYRGRRKKPRWLLALALFIVALVFVAGVGLFYLLQSYVVITNEVVYLDLPGREALTGEAVPRAEQSGEEPTENETPTPDGETPAPTDIPASLEGTQLIIEAPDYSDLSYEVGEELSHINALWASPDQVTADKLNSDFVLKMTDYGANALLLEVKDEHGQLAWSSSTAMAMSYGTSGTTNLSEIVTALKEKDIYLIAALSCCVDDLMATRNFPVALHNQLGNVCYGDLGAYLDPYNRSVRSYIADLSVELARMGFDEVVLTNLEHPVLKENESLIYSQEMTGEPSAVTAVSGFACYVREAIDDYNSDNSDDVKLSAYIMGVPLRESRLSACGQEVSVLMKIFDRLFVDSSASVVESDRQLVASVTESGDMSLRFIPVTVYPNESPDWVMTVLKTIESDKK